MVASDECPAEACSGDALGPRDYSGGGSGRRCAASMLGDGSGPLFEPGSGRGQVSAATEDGTGPPPAVLTTQVGRLYGQEGDRRSAAIPLGLYVRRWTR